MRSRLLLPLLAVALALGGCGSGHHAAPSVGATSGSSQPVCGGPVGTGAMGACVPKPVGAPLVGVTEHGPLFIDVSSYQGCVNFARHGAVRGAVTKATEGVTYTDSTYRCDQRSLIANHLFHGAYFYERHGECKAEVRHYVQVVGHPKIAYIDSEDRSLTASDNTCTIQQTKRQTHAKYVVLYTAPGTWHGADRKVLAHAHYLVLWTATYGSSPGHIPGFRRRVAWQFSGDCTGPQPHGFSFVSGCLDVDQDQGLLRLR